MVMTTEEKAIRYLAIDRQVSELEKEAEDLRLQLIDAVNEKFPNEKVTATITAGDYNIKRIAVAKLTWDLPELKKLVGETNYKEIVKVKESIDKSSLTKMEKKMELGVVEKNDLKKVSRVDYEARLKVKNKDENDNTKDEGNEFVELMDY